ncbi:MAG: glycosyltransferase [Candidatus Bathyarchaeota archaeon]|nr:glycosyltransferase [Candidatus Bathyarchaeota archaeon]
MTRKQILVFVILGICLTCSIGFFPVFADDFVKNNLRESTLRTQNRLVAVLKQAQQSGKVYLGVHGYNHICPLDGSTAYELSSPNGNLSYAEIEKRITAGLKIFDECDLQVDWYAFPGGEFDEQCLDVLSKNNFLMVPYPMKSGLSILPVSPQLKNYTFIYPLEEYTWMWREGVSNEKYQAALSEVTADKSNQILMHILDFNSQTEAFLEYAIANCEVSAIRCDDITTDDDLKNTVDLIAFARAHHVDLFLAVIPASKYFSSLGPLMNSFVSISWVLSLITFFLPVTVTLLWAVFFKFKRKIRKDDSYYPKVSLILPAYNEEKIIANSIKHALNQNYNGPIEIIIIDDGSTDKTRKIVQEFSENFSNVTLLCQPCNMGKHEALNAGFRVATGEICVFQDTDSIIAPNLVSLMVPHFEDPKVGMVAGMIVIENEKNLLTKLQQIEYLYSQNILRFCQASHKNVLICPGAATAVRTHIAKEIPSTDRTITEDADFTFTVWQKGWKISQEPDAVSFTEAPEKFNPFLDQRKRWLYGVLQTIFLHKWAVKSIKLWVLWAWLGYFMCPLTILVFLSPILLYVLIGPSVFLFFLVYSSLTLSTFAVAQSIGVVAYSRTKAKLLLFLPIYVVYQVILQVLLVYIVFAYLTRKGIYIKYGGKRIHAT